MLIGHGVFLLGVISGFRDTPIVRRDAEFDFVLAKRRLRVMEGSAEAGEADEELAFFFTVFTLDFVVVEVEFDAVPVVKL